MRTTEIRENNNDVTGATIARLWRSVGWDWYEDDDGYERTAHALNDERCTTFLALDGSEIIGLAHVLDNGFTAYLCYLVVVPEFQKRGVGKALLAAFDEKFFEFHRCMLADNSAVGFYKRAGYGHEDEYTAMAKWARERTAPRTA